ncbi:MAG: hypothetical protein H6707_11475 [Deltaproteobacteria bacterium]|nr:hypothetical protein [Deltaproteobacteria bacterium]
MQAAGEFFAEQELFELVSSAIPHYDDPTATALAAQIAEHPAVAAVIFYGSCLFRQTREPDSFYDFYTVVDSSRGYHSSLWHGALGSVLPPSIYFGQATVASGRHPFKNCVITLAQYRRQTSTSADDLHHLGRFSKRFALAYVRDDLAKAAIAQGAVSAMKALVPLSLNLLPERFDIEQFAKMQLSLSYLGERRVAEPTKVDRLFDAASDYYLQAAKLLLRIAAETHPELSQQSDGYFRLAGQQPKRAERMLQRSRRRGVLRWPKYLLTVDNWLDIQLDKLERNHGLTVELTALQRRYPLIFGWPKFFELLRQGLIK